MALKLLYRARFLSLIVIGESHPEVALIDSNIGLILHAVGEYDLSLKFLEKALELNLKYHGLKSLKVAVSYHLVARTQSCMGDFRSALQYEKETFAIYKTQLGDDHDKTKESGECLKHLTQQAVVLQKKMNEIYTGKSKATLPPIQIQPPSMGSVLDMLNIINGILFVQISQQDIENFKLEYEKRQKDTTNVVGGDTTKIIKSSVEKDNNSTDSSAAIECNNVDEKESTPHDNESSDNSSEKSVLSLIDESVKTDNATMDNEITAVIGDCHN